MPEECSRGGICPPSRAVYAWEGGRIPPLRFISGGGSLASPLRK
ncbi:hypothetical protein M096_0200 [Parabacteroides distasonis str. 3999B T(B) 6]|nr:hypothetical protein M096_0200 [Parabacteroides distasonis str. 3999B T(B) 6]